MSPPFPLPPPEERNQITIFLSTGYHILTSREVSLFPNAKQR